MIVRPLLDSPQVPVACPTCGDTSDGAREAMLVYGLEVPGVAVCSACAERIANAFHNRATGRWLTWPDDLPAPTLKKGRIDAQLKRRVHERHLYRCVKCGTHIDLTCDHIIPESKGGATTLENLQTMCRSCNSRRGNRA